MNFSFMINLLFLLNMSILLVAMVWIMIEEKRNPERKKVYLNTLLIIEFSYTGFLLVIAYLFYTIGVILEKRFTKLFSFLTSLYEIHKVKKRS